MTKQQKARAILGVTIVGNIVVLAMLWFIALPITDAVFTHVASYGISTSDFVPYMRGIIVGGSIIMCVGFTVLQLRKIKRVMGSSTAVSSGG